jgi:hypothetical protein
MFQTVRPPFWDKKPVFIIGGGPSFAGFDVEKLRGRGLIVGCNDAAFETKADVVMSMDVIWMRKRQEQVESFAGEVWLAPPPNWPINGWNRTDIHWIEKRWGWSISQDKDALHGSNTGFAAMNLAVLKGATTIYLLGFDMGNPPDQKRHWHNGYEWSEALSYQGAYAVWAKDFRQASADLKRCQVRVVNVNPNQTLPSYEHMDYPAFEQSLQELPC